MILSSDSSMVNNIVTGWQFQPISALRKKKMMYLVKEPCHILGKIKQMFKATNQVVTNG